MAILIRTSLLLTSCVVGLLLTEGAVRLTCRSCDPSGGVAFTHLPDGTAIGPANTKGRQIKNTGDYDVEVAFNRDGFRDRKSLQNAPAGSLFVVGDSFADRKSTRLNSSHIQKSRMPSSA